MSPRRHDFAGQRFGLLTALEDGPRYRNGERRYRCQCACGATLLVRVSLLNKGTTRSCGAPDCRRQVARPRKPVVRPKRLSAIERERSRAIAALIAAGGYGGENDARNWRDHRGHRKARAGRQTAAMPIPFIRAPVIRAPLSKTGRL